MQNLRMHAIVAIGTLAFPCAASAQAPEEPGNDRFTLGEIVVIGERPEGIASVGGSNITRDEIWTFQKPTLDAAVNLAPGVVSTFDANGRRNESDIFVRGFGRWQVPLMVDGVRIYLPADNRLDFGRFLTADIAAVQIQKGYASVLDGPGAMGGAINLVTSTPSEPFQITGGLSAAGRGGVEGWNGYVIAGSRQETFYVQGSLTWSDRDSWSLSDDYTPVSGSLEDGGERLGSDTQDQRINLKLGYTPNDTDEYVLNFIQQEGEKGAPLNVYNNPPVPPNSFWLWPYWDVQNTSFHTTTRLGDASWIETKTYYNTFDNALSAYDDITYSTQNQGRAFLSLYDDHAYGTEIELGTERFAGNTLKMAVFYRKDFHTETQVSRPTDPVLTSTEPEQEQSQETWSIAVENTFHVSDELDVVAGVSYDDYEVTRAEEFDEDIAPGIFEYPKGGSDAFNWQGAVIYRYSDNAQVHASVSDRGRFPTFFELYSTRFGSATPNPDLGPERATNFEIGWEMTTLGGARLGGAVFYNDVEDLVQTVVLPDTTTQTQNVGNGRFYGVELFFDAQPSDWLAIGGNYSHIDRTIRDALQPELQAEGVPENKAFLYATWTPVEQLAITPSVEAADDRWSSVNPPMPAPYVETGAYTLVNLDARYVFANDIEAAVGVKNLLDEYYELGWGYPQPGRSIYANVRMSF